MNQILELSIGLVLVFTVVSLGVSVLVEWLSAILAMRGKLLWKGIDNMLGKQWGSELCRHPLLESLTRRTWLDSLFPFLNRGKPSYLSAKTFSAALLGVLDSNGMAAPGDDLVAAVGKLPSGHLKQVLQPLVDQAGKDLAKAQANLEHWFDASMDRVTGWYKRWSQLVLFVLGFGVALWFGVDTLLIARALWTNQELRGNVVALATEMVGDDECAKILGESAPTQGASGVEPEKAKECLEKYQHGLAQAQLPLAPFPKGGDGAEGPARPWSWWSWLLAVALAGGLFWLDAHHRPRVAPSDAAAQPGPLQRGLVLVGRVAVVLAVGVATSQLIMFVVDRFWYEGFPRWLGQHGAGFVITGVAVSFGAPFWFDLLGRLVKLRASGSRPQAASSAGTTSDNSAAGATDG